MLRRIVNNIGQAAADAHAMGIDGVYLHGHEGYLIEQLGNPPLTIASSDVMPIGVNLASI